MEEISVSHTQDQGQRGYVHIVFYKTSPPDKQEFSRFKKSLTNTGNRKNTERKKEKATYRIPAELKMSEILCIHRFNFAFCLEIFKKYPKEGRVSEI